MAGRPPKKLIIKDGKAKVGSNWFNVEPICDVCGKESPIAYERKSTGEKLYKTTCSKECLSKLKSKRSSDMVKSGRTKRVGNIFYGKGK